MRKPFQGVGNIVRFNWHFYVLAIALVLVLALSLPLLGTPWNWLVIFACIMIVVTTFISLAVSFYVYDVSGLYSFSWINEIKMDGPGTIVNINAGFDETSEFLQNKFPHSELIVLDFYDPKKHTEISIKRARKAYPPFPDTQQVGTANLPPGDGQADVIFAIFSAHEIRNESERIAFFCELRRVLKPNGKIAVMEHLRDVPNFLAYNIGFFHFHAKDAWNKTFRESHLSIHKELKINPFVTTYILGKHGDTP